MRQALPRAVRRLADRFERDGWDVQLPEQPGPDLLVAKGPVHYAVELKVAREARKDRLIPLLSQAILQARSHARGLDALPMAVIMAPHLSARALEAVLEFAGEHRDDVAVGIVDLDGFASFLGEGLQSLQLPLAELRPSQRRLKPLAAPQLFSDLNQWMLKVLLAPRIPEDMLAAPRGEYRNVSELAKTANVSVMSAYRLQQLLLAEGFLDEGAGVLKLVRIPELVRLWEAACAQGPRDLRMRWLLPASDPISQLHQALANYAASRKDDQPRCCLGLFAAANALGVAFVQGIPPHVYIEPMSSSTGYQLGLAPASPGEQVDVFVRQPRAPESMFRGAVRRHGFLVCDVLQILLDVGNYPARGVEQAEQLRQVVLADLVRGS